MQLVLRQGERIRVPDGVALFPEGDRDAVGEAGWPPCRKAATLNLGPRWLDIRASFRSPPRADLEGEAVVQAQNLTA
jgi:hypothetical protein